MSEKTEDAKSKLKEKTINLIFELITEIPDSLHCATDDPDAKVKSLIQQASFKAATVSATLSIPAGFTGILTAIPDIAAIWRIQAQLVADVAATYGKLAVLTREAMVWCLFRHSAASLLRTSPSVPAAASWCRSFPRPLSRRLSRKLDSRFRLPS